MTNILNGIRQHAAKSKLNKNRVKKYVGGFTWSTFRYMLLICLSYMLLYPLLQLVTKAFTNPYDIGSTAFLWIPPQPSLDNIRMAWHLLRYPTSFTYTLISTIIVAGLQMIGSAFFGYAFARLKFRGSNILFLLVILTIIVPQSAIMLPQYIFFRNFDIFGIFKLTTGSTLNLLGERSSLFVLSAFGQGLSGGLFIYIFRQFFRGLPKELEEAAYVDGAGFLRTFFFIVLPMAKMGFVTVGVLSFVWNWNDAYFPRLFNPTDNYLTIRLGTLSASSGGTSQVQLAIGNIVSSLPADIVRLKTQPYDANMISTSSLMIIAPLLIFFLIMQKQFVEGIERSGIVG